MKKVSILGSTGSIGTQTLSVIREHREQFSVTALCCGKNTELLSRQIEEFAPRLAVTAEEADARLLAQKFPHMDILYGEEGLLAAAEDDSDILLNALMIPEMGALGAAMTGSAVSAMASSTRSVSSALHTEGREVLALKTISAAMAMSAVFST